MQKNVKRCFHPVLNFFMHFLFLSLFSICTEKDRECLRSVKICVAVVLDVV